MSKLSLGIVTILLLSNFAVASISAGDVAAVLVRDRGLEINPAQIRMPLTRQDCDQPRVASIRTTRLGLDVSVRCAASKPSILVRLIGSGTQQRKLVATFPITIPLVVRRGNLVRLSFHQDAALFSVPAVALEDGIAGQRIRIRISGTHQERIARVGTLGMEEQ